MNRIDSKTAYRHPRKFFLHVVYCIIKGEWELIHSSMPLANGGGQSIMSDATQGIVIDAARRLEKPTDEVLIHEDVQIGSYDPQTNSMLVNR